jgi:solute carrier family 25 uncoupling protein 8/9
MPVARFTCLVCLPTGAAPGIYSGVLDCFVKTFKSDGPLAFYNGFSSNFARLGSWK